MTAASDHGTKLSAACLRDACAQACPEVGIELAGAVNLPCRLPHQPAWHGWLESGRHAQLAYLSRDPAGRADPTRSNPWARSLLVFAQRYTAGWSPQDASGKVGARPGRPWTEGVARYARGLDYHQVLLAGIETVIARLAGEVPDLRAHPAVDTGPYLEREYAWLAGLGFFGKNTCLIHERLGSGLFLGVALTNAHVIGLPSGGVPASEPLWAVIPRGQKSRGSWRSGRDPDNLPHGSGLDASVASRCGRCRLCLDACPTGALDASFRLDATRCIATWTIEWRGQAPADRRYQQGGWVFGCDICQSVCPWNHKAAARGTGPPIRTEYSDLATHAEVDLSALVRVSEAEFRRRFRHTPLWRAHPGGMRRNCLTVAANTRQRELVEEVLRADRQHPDFELTALLKWAQEQVREAEP